MMLKTHGIKGLIVFSCILFITLSNAADAESNGISLKATEIVKTSFLSPGEKNAELQLIIDNGMDSAMNDVKVYLFLNSPFTASISPNDKINDLNYPGYLIGPGDSEYVPGFDIGAKEGRTVKFKVDVDKNAKYGNYDLPYAIHYGNKVINGKFTVKVSGSTLVEVTDVSTNPEKIVPGDDFEITFKVKNSGENSIKWINAGISTEDSRIIPASSSSEQLFVDMHVNSSRTASYMFSTDRKITPRTYQLNVRLTYQDENGILYNDTKIIGVKIIGKAGIEIASLKVEPDRILQGDPFTLTIRIENNEQGDARSVIAEIDVPVTGDKTAFLGKIAADEDAPAVYMLNADKSGKFDYNLTLFYNDDLGEHKKVQQMSLLVYPKGNDNILLLGGLAAFIAIGYKYWRSKKGA